MPSGIGLGQPDPESLTSQFLAELADPPYRLVAADGDATSIFAEQMRASEQNPEQAMLNIALTAAANLLRSDGDPKAALVKMKDQMVAAASEVREEA